MISTIIPIHRFSLEQAPFLLPTEHYLLLPKHIAAISINMHPHLLDGAHL
ncbi:hypothetical protein [Legionella qingyii]|nr:hypothetical protein [Legionella qingyii]